MEKFKVGDEVYIDTQRNPFSNSNYLGEGGRVTHTGPFVVERMDGAFVRRMSGIDVTLGPGRFLLRPKIKDTYEIY